MREEPIRGKPRDDDDEPMPVTRRSIARKRAKDVIVGAAKQALKDAFERAVKKKPSKGKPVPPKKKVVQADLFDDDEEEDDLPEDGLPEDEEDDDEGSPGPRKRTAATYSKNKKPSKAADKALEQANAIQELIEDIPDRIKQKAMDFFEDVYEHVGEVAKTIEKIGQVSDRQQTALNNWEAAIKKWHPDYRNR